MRWHSYETCAGTPSPAREGNLTCFAAGGSDVDCTFLKRGHKLMVKVLD